MGALSDGRFWAGVVLALLAVYFYGRWQASKSNTAQ